MRENGTENRNYRIPGKNSESRGLTGKCVPCGAKTKPKSSPAAEKRKNAKGEKSGTEKAPQTFLISESMSLSSREIACPSLRCPAGSRCSSSPASGAV